MGALLEQTGYVRLSRFGFWVSAERRIGLSRAWVEMHSLSELEREVRKESAREWRWYTVRSLPEHMLERVLRAVYLERS